MKILTAGKYYGVKKSEIDLTGVILSEYDYSLYQEEQWMV